MAITPTYPGVYIQELPSAVHAITGVATSITAFVGFTARGVDNRAEQIFSFANYERLFGGLAPDSEVSYAVQQFFANGGTEAYVVRVPRHGAKGAQVVFNSLTFTALSSGTWADGRLILDVDYNGVDQSKDATAFNLTVTNLADGTVETFPNVSLNSTLKNYIAAVVNDPDKLDRSDKPQSRKLAKAIDLDELLAVVKALPHRWATFGLVKVLTGLRWGEIASLEWTDVDFQTGKINVQRATPAGTSGAGDPKSLTSRRSVDMLWPVKQALLDMPQRGRLVFPGVRGGPLSYGWFSRYVWRPAAAEAGSRLRLHGLRHGFASLLLAWEEPILYVSQQLGHSSAGFTLSTYAHLIQQGRKLDKETTLRKLATAAHRPRFPRVPQRRLVENPKAPKTTEK
jgi:integrase